LTRPYSRRMPLNSAVPTAFSNPRMRASRSSPEPQLCKRAFVQVQLCVGDVEGDIDRTVRASIAVSQLEIIHTNGRIVVVVGIGELGPCLIRQT